MNIGMMTKTNWVHHIIFENLFFNQRKWNLKISKTNCAIIPSKIKTYFKSVTYQFDAKMLSQVQPLIKLGVQKTILWELFGFLKNTQLVPLFGPITFC
jgi:hypothetical protein